MQNILIIEIEIHDDIGIDDMEGRTNEKSHEVFTVETPILRIRVCSFEDRHTLVVVE